MFRFCEASNGCSFCFASRLIKNFLEVQVFKSFFILSLLIVLNCLSTFAKFQISTRRKMSRRKNFLFSHWLLEPVGAENSSSEK